MLLRPPLARPARAARRPLGAREGAPLQPPVEAVQRRAVHRHRVLEPGAQLLQPVQLGQGGGAALQPGQLGLQLLARSCRCATASSSGSAGCRRRCGRPRRARGRRRCRPAARTRPGCRPGSCGRAPASAPRRRRRRPSPELEEGPALGEEARLGRAGDDEVEVVPPARVLGQRAVEHVPHHRLGVVAEGVGEQEELLAAGAQLVEGRAQLRVAAGRSGRGRRAPPP